MPFIDSFADPYDAGSDAFGDSADYGLGAPVLSPEEQQGRSPPPRTVSNDASEYPDALHFAPADPGNYHAWTLDGPRSIAKVVCHITDGHANLDGPVSMFQKAGTKASPHYIVGQDGTVVQMVRHRDIAWHAHVANPISIGIEHCARSPRELGPSDPGMPLTDAQLQSSAKLVQWLCGQFQLPLDRDHIQGHCEADPKTTHLDCPNKIWPWDRFMEMVKGS
jgi:N-acetyl-anhydromuramyl-L-alanine amidase AmpD